MPDIPDELMSELLQTFRIEAVEHLQTLNQALLKIERVQEESQRRDLVQNTFRAAHSLKGAARAVDWQEIESLAHEVENVLQQARDKDNLLEPKVCDVLYRMLDGIQHILDGQQVDTARLQTQLAIAVGSLSGTAHESTLSNKKVETELEDPVMSSPADDTIRVAVSKLDTLMAQTGELLISKINAEQRLSDLQPIRQGLTGWTRAWREVQTLLNHMNSDAGQRLRGVLTQHTNELQRMSRTLDTFEQALNGDALRLNMVTTDLQENVHRARMLPFQTMVLSLERAVRDAARTEGKQITFVIEGRDVELDKKVLETLKDPLLHLLRNAVAHGIESPEVREVNGKPPEGCVQLIVRQRGSEVSLTVSDDGHGFDLEGLRRARHNQAVAEQNDTNMDDAISLAFLPGVTTAPEVTAISGRGVGLDVVRKQVEDIHGRIAVNNVPGQGVTIEIIAPSSVTMTRGLMVRCGDEHFVLPLLTIERIIEVEETFSIGGKQMLRTDDTPLLLVSLAAVLERPGHPNGHPVSRLAVILSVAEQRLALLVDEVLSELELVVKAPGDPLRRVRNVAGAALLGSGKPIIVLNPGDLIRSGRGVQMSEPLFEDTRQDASLQVTRHILVVDDSITTRTLEKNILEAAGYEVTIAVNGVEALKRLKEHEIDLVVSDIQMPLMDGFTLARQIRESHDDQHLPIILVSSLESQEDREKGMLSGADAYIVKRGFNQSTLLSTIRKFLDE